MLCGEGGELVGIAADQDRLDRDEVTVRKWNTARVPDRQDRTDQMLAIAHPAGHSVHDHSNCARSHAHLPPTDHWSSENAFTGVPWRIASSLSPAQCA